MQGRQGDGGQPAREGVEGGELDRQVRLVSASIQDCIKGIALSQGRRVGRGTGQQR